MNSNHRTHAPQETGSFRNEYNKTTDRKKRYPRYTRIGGLGEIGKNTYCFEHGNEILNRRRRCPFSRGQPPRCRLCHPRLQPSAQAQPQAQGARHHARSRGSHRRHSVPVPHRSMSKRIYAPRFACALIRKKLEEHRMVKGVKLIEITDESSIHMKHFTVGFFNTIHSIPGFSGHIDQHAQRAHRRDRRFQVRPDPGRA